MRTASQRGKANRERGKRGEREVATLLKGYGYDARRGVQYSGKTGQADVEGLPGIHIEVKRTERLSIYDAMEQSSGDGRTGEVPIVMHRKDRKDWVVIMRADDFMEMYKYAEMYAEMGKETNNSVCGDDPNVRGTEEDATQ